MKTVYLFLATGFEEIEALTIVDMLRRAEIDITTVSISRNLQVEGAHGITVTADCTLLPGFCYFFNFGQCR